MTQGLDRAVRFDRFGGPEVLRLVEVPTPAPAAGQVRVRVHYAGLNPVDWKLAAGGPSRYAVELPSGNGNDFAGIVDAVGHGVTSLAVDDAVFGGVRFHAQAEHLVVDVERIARVPGGLALRDAAVLDIAGRTAWASVEAVRVGAGDTVLIGGAAGGVGVLAAQLCVLRGARVIGTASPGTSAFLADFGVEQVAYGDGLVERVRRMAPEGVQAVLDYAGAGTVDAALVLGVPVDRINTNADHEAVERFGVRNEGAHTMPGTTELIQLAELVATGRIRVPIAGEFPLDRVREAYEQLIDGHVHGKLVLNLRGRDG